MRMVFLIAIYFAFPAAGLLRSEVTEQEVSDTLVRQMVGFVDVIIEESDPVNPGIVYAKAPDDHNQNPCYPLAWLYKTKHPLNPYFGNTDLRDRALAICDRIVKIKSRLEWPCYVLCQIYEMLGDEISPLRKEQWKEYVQYYVEFRGQRPFGYTSPNHEAWNALAVLRAGQVFDQPSWQALGRRAMNQLVKLQNTLGYFDEGSHHGPSTKYNQLQLAAMLLFADYAQDKPVEAAAKKLSDFMLRYSFPDGWTSGALDGRQNGYVGYFGTLCYGWDRWPEHKTLTRRIFETRSRLGMLSPESEFFNLSDWYSYFGSWFVVDEYLAQQPDAPSAPLPQDSNGYLVTDSGPTFEGGAARNHDWMVIVSAINSHVPLIGQSLYRLDRQSRLDIWHQDVGLVVGGGHNLRGNEVALANAIVLTDWHDVSCEYGFFGETENYYDRLTTYVPRALKADITLERQRLIESFGQGDVAFEVQPLGNGRLNVAYEYDLANTEKLIVQLPLVVYHDTRVLVDGELFGGQEAMSVSDEVTLYSPSSGTTVKVTPPAGCSAKIRPPVHPIRWYKDDNVSNRYRPYYGINLLSVQIDNPSGRNGGRFKLEINGNQ
jgi:hypothetical protein